MYEASRCSPQHAAFELRTQHVESTGCLGGGEDGLVFWSGSCVLVCLVFVCCVVCFPVAFRWVTVARHGSAVAVAAAGFFAVLRCWCCIRVFACAAVIPLTCGQQRAVLNELRLERVRFVSDGACRQGHRKCRAYGGGNWLHLAIVHYFPLLQSTVKVASASPHRRCCPWTTSATARLEYKHLGAPQQLFFVLWHAPTVRTVSAAPRPLLRLESVLRVVCRRSCRGCRCAG